MSETILIEVRCKSDALEKPQAAEIELLASILPELLVLMQQQNEAED